VCREALYNEAMVVLRRKVRATSVPVGKSHVVLLLPSMTMLGISRVVRKKFST